MIWKLYKPDPWQPQCIRCQQITLYHKWNRESNIYVKILLLHVSGTVAVVLIPSYQIKKNVYFCAVKPESALGVWLNALWPLWPFGCLTSCLARSVLRRMTQLWSVSVINRLAAYSLWCRVESCFWDAAEMWRGAAGGNTSIVWNDCYQLQQLYRFLSLPWRWKWCGRHYWIWAPVEFYFFDRQTNISNANLIPSVTTVLLLPNSI